MSGRSQHQEGGRMNTVHMGTDIVSARTAANVFSGAQLVPGIAAGLVFALYIFGAAQTANSFAYLVGMTPIAWVAIEGVWRLFR